MMFTGIVEEAGKVVSAPKGSLTIAADVVLEGMEKGQHGGQRRLPDRN